MANYKNAVLIMQLTSEVDAGLCPCQPNGGRHFSKHDEMLRKTKRARPRPHEQRTLQQFCIFNVASYSTISFYRFNNFAVLFSRPPCLTAV